MASRTSQKTTKSMRRTAPLFWAPRGEDPEADDALAQALQLDAVAMVAWQRFSGKSKGKSKGQGKRQEQRQQSVFGGAQEASCRGQELYQLPSVRCARTLGRKRHLSQECQERRFAAATGARISDNRRRDTRFDLALTGDEMPLDATALVAHARLNASDIPVETPPKGTARCATTAETTACHSLIASTDTSVRWMAKRVQPSRHERHG